MAGLVLTLWRVWSQPVAGLVLGCGGFGTLARALPRLLLGGLAGFVGSLLFAGADPKNSRSIMQVATRPWCRTKSVMKPALASKSKSALRLASRAPRRRPIRGCA